MTAPQSATSLLIELEREKQRTEQEKQMTATRAAEAAARAAEAAARAAEARKRELEAETRLAQAKLQTMQLAKQLQDDLEKRLSPDEIMDKVYNDATYTPPVLVRGAPKPVSNLVTPEDKKKS